MLDFDSFAPCWVQDPVLLDALGRCMPAAKKPGFDRLAEVWRQRNDALFAQSMQLIATQLLHAARETQEVGSDLSYVKWLISSADRQSHAQALKDAMAAVAERLQRSMQQTQSALLRLHGWSRRCNKALTFTPRSTPGRLALRVLPPARPRAPRLIY